MRKLIIFSILLCSCTIWGQGKEWHVKPDIDNYHLNGDGSIDDPWSLQYALDGAGGAIEPGDIVWLHGDNRLFYDGNPTTNAIYKGHFTSTLEGTEDHYIKVASYPGEWAVIDGNIHNDALSGPISDSLVEIGQTNFPGLNSKIFILNVIKGFVHFDDFEITCLGKFSRINEARKVNSNPLDTSMCPNLHKFNFYEYTGIEHNPRSPDTGPIRNIISNLVIRNIPGVAIGSWKFTSDTDIYGNIFYHNGLLDVTGVGCDQPLDELVEEDGLWANPHLVGSVTVPPNTRGHAASIYTQNVSTTERRNIRNNIFQNCYDSGLIIWSANPSFSLLNYIQNYEVWKNVFINNGSHSRDETSNMIVSTNHNDISNVHVDSNVFYINSKTSFVSGVRVTSTLENIEFENNFIFNGTAGMQLDESNHGISFHHNFYAGKRMQVLASVTDYQSSPHPWSMDYNTYYTRPGSADMFTVPHPTPPPTFLTLNLTGFRSAYNDELHSSRTAFNTAIAAQTPPSHTIVNQNFYNSNKFYVTIYNPKEVSSDITVDFSEYSIPVGRDYIIRDVQNYFTILGSGTYNGTDVDFTIPNPAGSGVFELAVPLAADTATFGPSHTADSNPTHSNRDMNTYVIEFDCPDLLYELNVDHTVTDAQEYEAHHRVSFGTDYISEATSDVTARSEHEIVLRANTWIKNEASFHAYIDEDFCTIPLATEPFENPFDTNPTNIAAEDNPDEEEEEMRVRYSGHGLTGNKENPAFTVYPNPNSGVFNVKSTTSRKIKKIVISRVTNGQIIFEQQYDSGQAIPIDISKQPTGIYIVKAYFDNDKSYTKSILKR
jgi:hypothetical protein